MSNALQFVVGSSFFVSMGTLLLQAILPAPPSIVVHELTYEGGFVIQSRTVTGASEVTLLDWAAAVIDTSTQSPVENCEGVGTYGYPVGFGNFRMPLTQWVGDSDCDIGPGEYFLRAVWTDGSKQVVATSPVFVIQEEAEEDSSMLILRG